MESQFQNVAVGALKESKHNPRKSFDPKFIEELAASMREQGVIEPLIVRPNGAGAGHYEILAGANRFRAAKAAGLGEVPCIVRELDDRAALELMLLDNLLRAGVHPLEEARGYQGLMAIDATIKAEDIAAKIGKSAKYVWDRLKLLELAPEAEKLFESGKMSAGHAILLARLEAPEQKEMLAVLEEDLKYDEPMSVRDLENEIKWSKERKQREALQKEQREKDAAERAKNPGKKIDVAAEHAKEKKREEADKLKRKAERAARVATVEVILGKVKWPLPRGVIEQIVRLPASKAEKLSDLELARRIVNDICAGYDQEYWWEGNKSIERLGKAYDVKPIKPQKALSEADDAAILAKEMASDGTGKTRKKPRSKKKRNGPLKKGKKRG